MCKIFSQLGLFTEIFIRYIDSERAINPSFPGSQTGTGGVKKAWKMVLSKELAACVHGYHVYIEIWKVAVGEMLACE